MQMISGARNANLKLRQTEWQLFKSECIQNEE